MRLGDTEIAEHIGPGAVRRRLVERAPQVANRRLRRTLRERPLRCAPERRDDELIAGRNRADEVGRGLLGERTAIEQQLGGAAMGACALVGAHALEDAAADHRMDELDRVLVAEEIRPNERAGRRQRRRRVGPSECSGERKLRSVAEYRRCAQQAGGIGIEAGKASCDAMGDRLRPKLEHPRRLLGGGFRPFPPERIQQRSQIERVPARTRLQRCTESCVGLDP